MKDLITENKKLKKLVKDLKDELEFMKKKEQAMEEFVTRMNGYTSTSNDLSTRCLVKLQAIESIIFS